MTTVLENHINVDPEVRRESRGSPEQESPWTMWW